jgi:Uma2 family endonuclease
MPAGPASYCDRISIDEYERLVSVGAFDDSRIELINGYVVRKLENNPPHVWSVDATELGIPSILPAGWLVRRESPVRIPGSDEPEPDVAVVRGTREDFKKRHPDAGEIGLLVEVAESSIDRDRGEKLQAYARGGIPVYWIVNLIDERIEVYTDPAGGSYRTRRDFPRGSEAPVILDGIALGHIRVDDLLP